MPLTKIIKSLLLLGACCAAVAEAVPEVKIVREGGALSLADAMDKAEQQSPLRRASEAAERAAAARVSQTKGSRGPRLGIEANQGWIDENVNKLAGETLPNGTRVPDEISNASLVLSQPVTGLFTLQSKAEAEQKLAAAAHADVLYQRQDVRSRTAEAYVRVLKAARRLAISQESQTLIERQKKDADLQLAEGRLAKLDQERFELASTDAANQTADAAVSLEAAVIALQELIGWQPTAGSGWVLNDLSAEVPALKIAPQTRPELQVAEARTEAAKSYKSAAKVDYWPNVNAYVRYQRDFAAKDIVVPIPGFQATFPKEDYRDNFSYGFALNWVLWDWQQRQAHDAELSAEVQRSEQLKENVASQLRVEEAQARAEWQRAQDRLRSAEVALNLSQSIYKSFATKFKNGLATTTDVLAAERDQARSQASLADAQYDLHLAAIRLRRSLGGQP